MKLASKNIILTLLPFMLAFTIFVGVSAPQKAEAIFVPTNDVALNLTTTGIFGFNAEQWTKEYVLDLASYAASQGAVDAIVETIIKGILTKVNAIVKDFRAELIKLQNKVAKDLGIEIDLVDTCFAFPQFSIDRPADNANKFSAKLSCTLNTAGPTGATPEQFYADFTNGGWDSYQRVSFQTQNNPFGAWMNVQEQMSERDAEQKQKELEELRWGNGVRSLKDDDGKTKTPAGAVSGLFNVAFSSQIRRFEAADEVSEVVVNVISGFVKNLVQKNVLEGRF